MRSLFFVLFLIAPLIVPGCASSRAARNGLETKQQRAHFAQAIEKIIQEIDPNVNIGIKITDLDREQTVYEKNSQRHFVPASTNKLLIVASALYHLGPSYRFRTGIYTDGFKDDNKTVLNIYIKGSGDPSLMDTDLAALSLELKQMGIKKVLGNVFVDDTIFDGPLWSSGIMWDDRNRGFSAPVSGLNLNYNRIVIKTMPAHQEKLLARSVIRPATSFVYLSPKAITKTSANGKNVTVAVERDSTIEEDWPLAANEGLAQNDKITVNGQIPLNASPAYSLLAVRDPSILAGTVLKEQLEMAGISINGEVLRAKTPSSAHLLSEHESRALSEALIDFTKISNNVATDSLIKAIAANNGASPATFGEGLKLINEFLANEVGIAKGSLVTADGAGTSRYNLITPEQLNQILVYAATKFHMGPEFIAALPIAGLDGTLGHRLTLDHIKGNVRAKTGSMSGISSLAGYLNGDNGKRYSFVIMINGFIGSAQKYTKLQDAIVSSMLTEPKRETEALARVKVN